MKRAQIILTNGIELPHVSRDRYACWEEELSVTKIMAAGNMVKELKSPGKVWRVRYQFDYMGNDLMREVMAVLRRGDSFQAAVLPDNAEDYVPAQFFCVSLTAPTFAFSKNGVGLWHNLAFELREVEPHA